MKVYAYKHSIQRAIYLLIGAVLLLGLSGTAEATDIFVTSTAESGPGTLRDALTSAADGDTIVLPAGGGVSDEHDFRRRRQFHGTHCDTDDHLVHYHRG